MPITITPISTNGFVGPGLQISVQSDFIGPIPSGSYFSIDFLPHGSESISFTTTQITFDTQASWAPYLEGHEGSLTQNQGGITEGADADLSVSLHQVVSGVDTVIDSDNATLPFTNVQGVPNILAAIHEGAPSSTFNSTDRATLAAVAENVASTLGAVMTTVTTATGTVAATLGSIFQPATLDAFTLQEVTSGETCDTVTIGDLEFFFGIVVRSTSIPDYYGVGGYDGRHYEPSLALLNVFRGTEMVARIPIHVADYMMTPVPGQSASTEAQIIYLAVAPNLSLEVWWGNGVCGQVYLLKLP